MCMSTRSHRLWRQDFLPLNPLFSNVSSQIVVRVVIVVSAKSTTMLTWCLRSQRPRESAVIAQCSYLHFVSLVFCFFVFSIKIKYISARVRVNAYCTYKYMFRSMTLPKPSPYNPRLYGHPIFANTFAKSNIFMKSFQPVHKGPRKKVLTDTKRG